MEDMFNPDRPMNVSGEKDIKPDRLRYLNRKGQTDFTLPVIVPPVQNKREIYHSNILKLWDLANDVLLDADELVIYGYSCPSSDIDSKEFLRNALNRNEKIQKIPIIDTDSTIIDHYQQLVFSKKICRYDDVFQFLK